MFNIKTKFDLQKQLNINSEVVWQKNCYSVMIMKMILHNCNIYCNFHKFWY